MTGHSQPGPVLQPGWRQNVREKVEGLSFGVVQIVVHDRKAIQIEGTERTGFDHGDAESAAPRRRAAP